MMILVYGGEKQELQRSIKGELFSVKFASGSVYSNKTHPKVAEHKDECPGVWIYEEWQPQKLEDLKFIKA